jgi:hypothetical protein
MTIKPTNFEDIYKFSQNSFKALEGKQGFELYQTYRDTLFTILFDQPDGAKKYSRSTLDESNIVNLNLVDQKYIDNFILCLALKFNNPDDYDELKNIIDRNIKPNKRSQGWEHIYKEMSGVFVLFLSIYEDVSVRQADQVASQIFNVAENFPKSRYLNQKKKFKLSKDELPDIYTLALLFFCLQQKNKPIESISALIPDNTRSENELKSTTKGYIRFKNSVFNHYISIVDGLKSSTGNTILDEVDEDLGVSFLMNDNYPENPSEYEVFVVVCIALGMELMPNFMYHPEKFINFLDE